MGAPNRGSGSRFAQFLQPVLDAIAALGGSARPAEVKEWILKNLNLANDYVSAVHKGGESKFGNDVDWAFISSGRGISTPPNVASGR